MEKMDRNGKRIETGIQVEEYEILELKIEFSKYMHRKEYEKAEKILFEIESKIDRSEPENKQYVEVGKIQLKYHKTSRQFRRTCTATKSIVRDNIEI